MAGSLNHPRGLVRQPVAAVARIKLAIERRSGHFRRNGYFVANAPYISPATERADAVAEANRSEMRYVSEAPGAIGRLIAGRLFGYLCSRPVLMRTGYRSIGPGRSSANGKPAISGLF